MDTQKQPVSIDHAKCPPCSGLICVGVCPVGVLEQGTDKKPQVADAASCTRCGVCAELCPTKAITVVKAEKSSENQQ